MSSEVQHALVTGRILQPSYSKFVSSATGLRLNAFHCLWTQVLQIEPCQEKRTKINAAAVAEATGLEPCSCHVSHSEPLVSAQIQAFLNSYQAFISCRRVISNPNHSCPQVPNQKLQYGLHFTFMMSHVAALEGQPKVVLPTLGLPGDPVDHQICTVVLGSNNCVPGRVCRAVPEKCIPLDGVGLFPDI